MTPKIEILVIRDPDSWSDVRLFVDGSERDVFVYDVDAGAGYEDVDWAESYEDAKSRTDISEACRTELLRALANPPGQEYIDGWNWGESIEDVIARLREKQAQGLWACPSANGQLYQTILRQLRELGDMKIPADSVTETRDALIGIEAQLEMLLFDLKGGSADDHSNRTEWS